MDVERDRKRCSYVRLLKTLLRTAFYSPFHCMPSRENANLTMTHFSGTIHIRISSHSTPPLKLTTGITLTFCRPLHSAHSQQPSIYVSQEEIVWTGVETIYCCCCSVFGFKNYLKCITSGEICMEFNVCLKGND